MSDELKPAGYRCDGCGRLTKEYAHDFSPSFSCCPERDPQPLYARAADPGSNDTIPNSGNERGLVPLPADLIPPGHGETCFFCGEKCNGLAGSPQKIPVGLLHPDGSGVVKWHCMTCLVTRLFPEPADLDAIKYEILENVLSDEESDMDEVVVKILRYLAPRLGGIEKIEGLEEAAKMHEEEAQRLRGRRDIGMANHHAAWANKMRTAAKAQLDRQGGGV